MNFVVSRVLAPLASLFIFMLGSGLYTTLLAVRLHSEGASDIYIGALTGLYYLGLAVGSFKIEKYIIQVGHIRAFSAFASMLAVISFVQGIFVEHWIWMLLRFSGGFATAGIFITIESWLLSAGTEKTRGRILAFYMIALYAAQALGQLLINISSPKSLELFALIAMLSSMSVIPIALTKTPSPELTEPSSLGFKKLFKSSGSGVFGSFCSGLILSALYGLLPVAVLHRMGSVADAGFFMALVIFGGMFLQYPVGKLSDLIERRLVLLGLALLTALIAFLVSYVFVSEYLLYIGLFILGGIVFPIYPVSISHACDNFAPGDIVSAMQGMLLSYSIGASLGPFIAPIFMHFDQQHGLYIYLVTIGLMLALLLGWRKSYVPAAPQDESFVVTPQTSPVAAELDPRGDSV